MTRLGARVIWLGTYIERLKGKKSLSDHQHWSVAKAINAYNHQMTKFYEQGNTSLLPDRRSAETRWFSRED